MMMGVVATRAFGVSITFVGTGAVATTVAGTFVWLAATFGRMGLGLGATLGTWTRKSGEFTAHATIFPSCATKAVFNVFFARFICGASSRKRTLMTSSKGVPLMGVSPL